MKRFRRGRPVLALVLAGVAVCGLAALASLATRADAPASAAASGAKAAPAARSQEQIQADFRKTSNDLQAVLKDPGDLFDEAKRKELGPKVAPVLKRMVALFGEAAATDVSPEEKEALAGQRSLFQALLVVLGDAEAEAALGKAAGGGDRGEAVRAQATRLMGRYWRAGKDEAAGGAVVDEVRKLARENPENDALAQSIATMTQMGQAPPAVEERLMKVVVDELRGPTAEAMADQWRAEQKLKALVGKPITLTGTTLDGKPFTTADLKGKVILVDFWATWCVPCVAEMPRVKKAYADYHSKGLEVLGVSCDRRADALTAFLQRNPDMPWPQLFEADYPELHPLATEYGVRGIPTMFLIDRKGVVRSVEARVDFEEQIPKLLGEKAE